MTAARSFGPPVLAAFKHRTHVNGAGDRGQRVLLRVPANLIVALQGKEATFKVTTVSVSKQGALLVMERSLPRDTPLVLEHTRTRERVACRVSNPVREMPEGFHVPIEFDSPAPDFWKIAFPPSDWQPPD